MNSKTIFAAALAALVLSAPAAYADQVTGTLSTGATNTMSGSGSTSTASGGSSLSGTVATSSSSSLSGTVATSSSSSLTGTVTAPSNSLTGTVTAPASSGTSGGGGGGANGPPVGVLGGGGGGGSDMINICPNLSGTYTSLPAGYVLINGNCEPGSTTGTTGGSPAGQVLGASTGPSTPGIPNTGEGGNAPSNLLILMVSAFAALLGIVLLAREYRTLRQG